MTPEEKLASGHQAKERPRILVFVDHYLPAFKFGGPVRTLANLVTHLGSRYEFFVFTRDRDQGDPSPYQQIALDRWCPQRVPRFTTLQTGRCETFRAGWTRSSPV